MPRVAIVIGNYNGVSTQYEGKPLFDVCVHSIKQTAYKNYKVVVVDGGSTDGSVEYIEDRLRTAAIIKDKKNYGYARSNNGGIEFLIRRYNPQYILLLNNDIIVEDKDWLTNLVKTAERDKQIGIVGCKLIYPNGLIQHAGIKISIAPHNIARAERDTAQQDYVGEIDAVTGAVMLIKRKVINKVGLLDSNFFMGYEDIDYCLRTKRAGFKIVYNGKVKLVHLEGFTSTYSLDSKKKDLLAFTGQRNYLYFAFKNFGFVNKILAIPVAFLMAIMSIEGKTRSRGLGSIRIKERVLWRIATTAHAIRAAIELQSSGSRIDYSPKQFKIIRN
ncbi:MAG: glycosyltransferase family 2 protein [Candidatus Marsarchaeota archaeon]|nr:glycosyltransferase family 2 protein [Candidatus Marsarchaeota archaeon]